MVSSPSPKLILSSTDYSSLKSCLLSYVGKDPLGDVFVYISEFEGRYFCVLDNCYPIDFDSLDGVDIIKPHLLLRCN